MVLTFDLVTNSELHDELTSLAKRLYDKILAEGGGKDVVNNILLIIVVYKVI